jgi:hypothetical protein
VIGIFKEEAQAKNVVDVLRDAGFSADQIGVAIASRETITHNILNDLVNMGALEEEVNYYAREFEAGRSIVWVRHNGRQLEVASILILNGTRMHKYFNISRSDAPTSPNERGENQFEAFQSSSSSTSSNKPSPLIVEETTADEMPPWMRILKDAGFDHLI